VAGSTRPPDLCACSLCTQDMALVSACDDVNIRPHDSRREYCNSNGVSHHSCLMMLFLSFSRYHSTPLYYMRRCLIYHLIHFFRCGVGVRAFLSGPPPDSRRSAPVPERRKQRTCCISRLTVFCGAQDCWRSCDYGHGGGACVFGAAKRGGVSHATFEYCDPDWCTSCDTYPIERLTNNQQDYMCL